MQLLITKVDALNQQNMNMMQELRELHREKATLRRQLDLARGIQIHQPYFPPPHLPRSESCSLLPPPRPPASSSATSPPITKR